MRYFYLMLCVFFSASISIAAPGIRSAHADQGGMNSGLSFALSHVPDQHAVVWVNRDSRLYGEIVPLKTYRTSYGQVCREYASLSFTSSGQQQGFGMACRQDDGSWQLAGQKSVRGSMNGALVHAKNQAQLCSYFSHWHPPVKGMVQPRKRYHSEEFLRQYQHAPRQRLPSPVTIPQLVVN